MDTTTTKDKLARFGRDFALLLNRGLMYNKSHPMVKDSIKQVFRMAKLIFVKISPLVFILNREQFYVDEEQLDPRINTKRIATLFKNHNIQSVSFEDGLSPSELDILIDIFSSLTMSMDDEYIKKALFSRGAFNIKINHVLYKKVTQDDQIISREALKEVTPGIEAEDSKSRKKFMDTLLETILTEEFANTLNIKSLMANPRMVSQNMIKADMASAQQLGRRRPGQGTKKGTGTLRMEEQDGGEESADVGVEGAPGAGTKGSGKSAAGGGPAAGPTTGRPGQGGGTGPAGTPTGGGPAGGGPGQGAGTGMAGAPTGGGPAGGGPGQGAGTGMAGAPSGGGPAGGGPGQGAGTGMTGASTGIGTGSPGDQPGMGIPGSGPTMGEGSVAAGDASGERIETGSAEDGAGVAIGLSATASSPSTTPGNETSEDLMGAAISGGADAPASAAAILAEGMGSGPGMGMDDGGDGHGPMLLHQLEILQAELQKQLQEGGEVSLEELADAIFEMKKQFFEDLQTQKALGIAYANEEAIVDNLNRLTDQVILKLIQEEYNAGKITTQRLAQIILRLIPEPQELRRLLPQIKEALIQAGMPPEDYLDLIDKLKKELQNEDLVRILEESSEAIGVNSGELIDELRRNPDQAAKLIYLASEINKGTGDEAALADILVDYVEKMTAQAAQQATETGADGDAHLKKVVANVESTLLQQLGKFNVGDDVLGRMESRINERMDSILDKMRVEWINAQAGISRKEKQVRLSVLQTLEQSVNDDEELSEILTVVRAKVEAGEIEENNFSQIDSEITRQRKILQQQAAALDMPQGVLTPDEVIFILEKEIARANRYNAPFSALAFSFVTAKPRMKALNKLLTADTIMTAALEKLAGTIREVDYIGQIGKNKMVAVLPMIGYPAAKTALMRVMNLLHSKPLQVHEVPVDLRVAGVVAQFNSEQTPSAQAFAKHLSNQLMDMVARVKNIQVLF